MDTIFYITAAVSVVATLMVISRHNPVHALLYLIVSLLSLSVLFYLMGAPFAALLEIIIYAGAIMVLFIFVIMLLNLGEATAKQEKEWLKPRIWVGPAILSLIVFAELFYLIYTSDPENNSAIQTVDSKMVAVSLFQPYILAVELVAMLLMAGVVGAAHIGQHKKTNLHRFLKETDDL